MTPFHVVLLTGYLTAAPCPEALAIDAALAQFPGLAEARRNEALADAHLEYLYGRRPLERDNPAWDDLIREAQHSSAVWTWLRQARRADYSIEYREACVSNLERCLGPERWAFAEMPDPIPFWHCELCDGH